MPEVPGPVLGRVRECLPGGGTHDGSQSLDYAVGEVRSGDPGGADWFWCKLCSGLFYTGNATTGWCPVPAAGEHRYDPNGNMYAVAELGGGTGAGAGAAQANWKRCNRCQGLFYTGNGTTGCCPAGGGHNYQYSPDYFFRIDLKEPI